jgi:hypothetical protein
VDGTYTYFFFFFFWGGRPAAEDETAEIDHREGKEQ